MSTNDEPGPQRKHRVLDAGALRALGHPLRVKIYEALSQRGPQTASTLAAALDESSGATSYHLRTLARHGLIQEDTEQPSRRERWWRRTPGGVTVSDEAVKGSPAGEAAMQLAVAELLRHRYDEAMQFFTTRIDREPTEWRDASIATTSGVPMTAAQAKDLTEKLQAVIDAAADTYREQVGDGVRHVTVRADVFPLAEHNTSKERTP